MLTFARFLLTRQFILFYLRNRIIKPPREAILFDEYHPNGIKIFT